MVGRGGRDLPTGKETVPPQICPELLFPSGRLGIQGLSPPACSPVALPLACLKSMMRQGCQPPFSIIKESGSPEGKGGRGTEVACDPQSRAEWLLKFLKMQLWDVVATAYALPSGRALPPLPSVEKPDGACGTLQSSCETRAFRLHGDRGATPVALCAAPAHCLPVLLVLLLPLPSSCFPSVRE